MRVRIAGIERDCTLEHPQRLFIVCSRGPVVEPLASEDTFIRREIFWRFALHAVVRGGSERPGRIETIDDVTSSWMAKMLASSRS